MQAEASFMVGKAFPDLPHATLAVLAREFSRAYLEAKGQLDELPPNAVQFLLHSTEVVGRLTDFTLDSGSQVQARRSRVVKRAGRAVLLIDMYCHRAGAPRGSLAEDLITPYGLVRHPRVGCQFRISVEWPLCSCSDCATIIFPAGLDGHQNHDPAAESIVDSDDPFRALTAHAYAEMWQLAMSGNVPVDRLTVDINAAAEADYQARLHARRTARPGPPFPSAAEHLSSRVHVLQHDSRYAVASQAPLLLRPRGTRDTGRRRGTKLGTDASAHATTATAGGAVEDGATLESAVAPDAIAPQAEAAAASATEARLTDATTSADDYDDAGVVLDDDDRASEAGEEPKAAGGAAAAAGVDDVEVGGAAGRAVDDAAGVAAHRCPGCGVIPPLVLQYAEEALVKGGRLDIPLEAALAYCGMPATFGPGRRFVDADYVRTTVEEAKNAIREGRSSWQDFLTKLHCVYVAHGFAHMLAYVSETCVPTC